MVAKPPQPLHPSAPSTPTPLHLSSSSPHQLSTSPPHEGCQPHSKASAKSRSLSPPGFEGGGPTEELFATAAAAMLEATAEYRSSFNLALQENPALQELFTPLPEPSDWRKEDDARARLCALLMMHALPVLRSPHTYGEASARGKEDDAHACPAHVKCYDKGDGHATSASVSNSVGRDDEPSSPSSSQGENNETGQAAAAATQQTAITATIAACENVAAQLTFHDARGNILVSATGTVRQIGKAVCQASPGCQPESLDTFVCAAAAVGDIVTQSCEACVGGLREAHGPTEGCQLHTATCGLELNGGGMQDGDEQQQVWCPRHFQVGKDAWPHIKSDANHVGDMSCGCSAGTCHVCGRQPEDVGFPWGIE